MSDILGTLQHLKLATGHEPIVAGGFIRDVSLGISPKDVDIFVEHPKSTTAFNIFSNLRKQGFRPRPVDPYKSVSCIVNMYDGTVDGLPCQIILTSVDSVKVVKEHFDYGICMAWIGRDGKPEYDPRFLKDVDNKTCTLYVRNVPEGGGHTIISHGLRLKDKFPDYKFVMDFT